MSHLITLVAGFVLGFAARNLRRWDADPAIPIHTVERRQMMVRAGDL